MSAYDRLLHLCSLREDTLVEDQDGDGVVVFSRWGEIRLPAVDTRLREWLRRMALGPAAAENVLGGRPGPVATRLAARVPAAGVDGPEPPELVELMRSLDPLAGVVVHSLGMDGEVGPLLSAVPIAARASFAVDGLDGGDAVRLSRFAVLRGLDGTPVVESALAPYRVLLYRPQAVRVAAALAAAVPLDGLATATELPDVLARELVAYLVGAGVAVLGHRDRTDGAGDGRPVVFAEDADPALMWWPYQDLLFHARGALGHDDVATGAVYQHSDRLPPPPPIQRRPGRLHIPLHRPSPGAGIGPDQLPDVVGDDRSSRHFGGELGGDALGELLFRTARVCSVDPAPGAAGARHAVARRPYPAPGGVHALELYLTVDRCRDLDRGVYHYDALAHRVTLLDTARSRTADLLDQARISGGLGERPPALITIVAHLPRLSWVYGGSVYAMALMQVGILQQTLHLVAAALHLASCPLAGGGGDLATEVCGLDWPNEVAVGGFAVGPPP